MWKNIKKFFKWIADHTGISWVARKISSGWKWLFGGKAKQNTPQQEERSDNEKHEPAQANDQSKDHTTPKTPAPSRPTPAAEPEGLKTSGGDSSVTSLPCEPLKTATQEPAQPTLDEKSQKSVVNKKEDEFKLNTDLNGINLSSKQALMVQSYKSHNVNTDKLFTELLIYIKCDKDEYRVVGSTFGGPTSIFSVPIVSIVKKNENGKYLDSNIKYPANKDVQEMLGLKDNVTTVKVDSISNEPFEGTALEPNTTTTQQTVNNDSNREVAAEEHASGSTITDQATEQPASGSEVASPSGTTADYNEPEPECIKIIGEELRLVVSADKKDFILASKNPSNSEEYLVCVKHAKGRLQITGSKLQYVSAGNEFLFFSISSMATQDGKTVSSDPVEMKKMLGLEESKGFTDMTRISGTLNQSNTNAIGNDATQQAVSNEEVATESEKFHDAEDGGVTQPTPSAVPNKSQGNSIVIPEEAKLKFSPETSDFLSRTNLEREMLFCKVAPNSLFTQPIPKQVTGSDLLVN